jgi:hypothetical protein
LIPKFGPDDYERLLQHDIGLTDLAIHSSGMDGDLPPGCFDTARLRRKIEVASPSMLAFNGKKAAAAFFDVRPDSPEQQHGRGTRLIRLNWYMPVDASRISLGRQKGALGEE